MNDEEATQLWQKSLDEKRLERWKQWADKVGPAPAGLMAGSPAQALRLTAKGSYEYAVISEHYGDQTAKRSGLRLMNHIDEGLMLLSWLDADINTMKAWCVHPIVQSGLVYEGRGMREVSHVPRMLAFDYMRYANAYLSPRTIASIDEIYRPDVDTPVHRMLIADKVQNRKDYERYQVPSERLTIYFRNWLDRLGVTEEQYQGLVSGLDEVQREQAD